MQRYRIVTGKKAAGATYTPQSLAAFVARQMVNALRTPETRHPIRILDPAVGEGELLIALLREVYKLNRSASVKVYGFDTHEGSIARATERIHSVFSDVSVCFEQVSFLDFVIDHFGDGMNGNLFRPSLHDAYDLIIANPPYVRTQIMGARQAQFLAHQFGLSGRVDLYYAFILAMARVLKPKGVAGIIVSNRFMTTKAGASIRQALLEQFDLRHVWDLGDTKLFEAAVLPAVLLAQGKNSRQSEPPRFTSVYETKQTPCESAKTPLDALDKEGVVAIDDGRSFIVHQGRLDTSGARTGVWRIATESVDRWLETVRLHTSGTFRDIGKIRVGVKTCADKVFIRCDWSDLPMVERPELLRTLTTHHVSRRFRALRVQPARQILYPHHSVHGRRRPADLSKYPRTRAYLERHRQHLEARKYVLEAGRAWYEIWVPQDPEAWDLPKLVFRDISEEPVFWVDLDGTVVNGDCYWIAPNDLSKSTVNLIWLAAAVANSTFIEQFYDYRFNNKLYAGRRRFITQYVEQFPLPDPSTFLAESIATKARDIYECLPSDSLRASQIQAELNSMVWRSFGLPIEKV